MVATIEPRSETRQATVWQIDPSHSLVEFAVKHMMFATVKGRFAAFEGEVVTHPEDPTEGEVNFSIDADSIDTRDEKRDEHLRSNDFFGAGDNPQIVFTSTGVEHIPGSTFRVHGDLTIKGVTRPVVLDAEFNGIVPNLQGGRRAAFSATTKINREDWGLTWNVALEQGGWLVSKEIKIEIDLAVVEGAEQAEAQAEAEAEMDEREAAERSA